MMKKKTVRLTLYRYAGRFLFFRIKNRCNERDITYAILSLKSERLSDYRFVTRLSAEMQILDYISYYNSIRLYSPLGYKTPFAYEKERCRKAA